MLATVHTMVGIVSLARATLTEAVEAGYDMGCFDQIQPSASGRSEYGLSVHEMQAAGMESCFGVNGPSSML